MRSIRHIKPLLVVPLLAIAAFAFGMVYERAYAAESNINNSGESQLKIDTVTTNPTDISTPASDTNYSYVAQPGDSYTQMARKAAQT